MPSPTSNAPAANVPAPHDRSLLAQARSCGAMLGTRLRAILNTEPEASRAHTVALGVGASAGLLVGAVFNPQGDLGEAALFGAALGSLWHMTVLGRRQQVQAHRRRIAELEAFACGRRLLETLGGHAADPTRVEQAHSLLIKAMDELDASFQTYCIDRGVPFNPVITRILQAFFLEFCGILEACVLYSRDEHCFYIAAVPKERLSEVRARVDGEGFTARGLLEASGLVFLRCPRDCAGLDAGGTFTFRMHRTECEVQPQPRQDPAPATGVEAGAEARRVRSLFASGYLGCNHDDATRLSTRRGKAASGDRRSPTPSLPSSPSLSDGDTKQARRGVVRWSPRLRQQCGHLPVENVTRAAIETLSADLLAGRICGHTVKLGGEVHLATDINIAGLSGRNRWRLLYGRTAEGYELHGIADYHRGPARATTWWRG